MAVESSTRKTEKQADWDLGLADAEVGRNLPAALAVVLPAQHQHGQAVEGERPDDAEGVGLAEHDDIARLTMMVNICRMKTRLTMR
jgi:hypothetical protein